jgi:hypothetical protein
MNKSDEQYNKEEAQRRFAAALKAALNTPPRPLKDIPKKRAAAQSKRKAKAR